MLSVFYVRKNCLFHISIQFLQPLILITMRFNLEQLSDYKKTILDAIVMISTSDAVVESDICNLQDIYYLLEAVEADTLQLKEVA